MKFWFYGLPMRQATIKLYHDIVHLMWPGSCNYLQLYFLLQQVQLNLMLYIQTIPSLAPYILSLLGEDNVEENLGPSVYEDTAVRWEKILKQGLEVDIKNQLIYPLLHTASQKFIQKLRAPFLKLRCTGINVELINKNKFQLVCQQWVRF